TRFSRDWSSDVCSSDLGGGVDHGDFDGGLVVELGEDPGESAGQHRLAPARWSVEEDVVTAGGCDLHGPSRQRLTLHVGDVRRVRWDHVVVGPGRFPRGRTVAEEGDCLGKRVDAVDLCSRHHRHADATDRETRQGTPVFAERTAAPMLPPAGRTLPSRPNSPTATASTCPVTTPEAASTPRAIGRSKSVPDLGRSAGARFTVTLRLGKWRPVELI